MVAGGSHKCLFLRVDSPACLSLAHAPVGSLITCSSLVAALNAGLSSSLSSWRASLHTSPDAAPHSPPRTAYFGCPAAPGQISRQAKGQDRSEFPRFFESSCRCVQGHFSNYRLFPADLTRLKVRFTDCIAASAADLRQEVAVPILALSAAPLLRRRDGLAEGSERRRIRLRRSSVQQYRRLAHESVCPSKSETGRFRPTYSSYPYTGSLSPLRLFGPAVFDVRVVDRRSRGRRRTISDLGALVRRSGLGCATYGTTCSAVGSNEVMCRENRAECRGYGHTETEHTTLFS